MTFPRPCCTPGVYFCQWYDSILVVKNIQPALFKISEDSRRLTDWFEENKLPLYVNETNYVIFTRSQNAMSQHSLRIGNEIMNCVTHDKFLGIIIDNTLVWN